MNRREFLKWAGVSAAVVAVPSLAEPIVPAYYGITHEDVFPDFHPDKEYSNYVILTDRMDEMDEEFRPKIYEVVERDMFSQIPPEYRDKVIYSEINYPDADPFGEIQHILEWKYKP